MKPFLWGSPLHFLAFACLASGCGFWLDPLTETPENMRFAVFTVSLRDGKRTPTPEASARKMVQEASDYWESHCGLSFKHVAHFERDAAKDGMPTAAETNGDVRALAYRYSHLNYISAVFTGNINAFSDEDRTVGGLSVYPWGDRRAILMVGPYDGIFAHELGHYFSLGHVEDNGWNLMFPADLVSQMKYVLTPDQCADAKRYALGYAHHRELCRPDAADLELSKGNCPQIEL